MFLDKQRNFADEFLAASKSDDPKATTRAAHTLKGVAGNIGAKGIAVAAEDLELACQDGKPARKIKALLKVVAAELDPVIAALEGLDNVTEEMPVSGAESAGAPTIEEAEAQNRLILLVEDDATNQLVIKHQLRILGYAMEIADDGKRGLEMWQTGRFGLVLTDCHMPVMDGFEMTDAIREAEKQSGLSHVPIVAITANALQDEAERCLAAGMDAYVSKPVELARLKITLETWLPKES